MSSSGEHESESIIQSPVERFGRDIGLARNYGDALMILSRYIQEEYGDTIDSGVLIESLIRQGQFPTDEEFDFDSSDAQDKLRLILFDQLLPLYEISHLESPIDVATFTNNAVAEIVEGTRHDSVDCEIILFHLSKKCDGICPIYGMVRSTLELRFADSRDHQQLGDNLSEEVFDSQASGIANRLQAMYQYDVLDGEDASSYLWARD